MGFCGLCADGERDVARVFPFCGLARVSLHSAPRRARCQSAGDPTGDPGGHSTVVPPPNAMTIAAIVLLCCVPWTIRTTTNARIVPLRSVFGLHFGWG